MSAYQSFTSPRNTEPDPTTLLNQLRALDATAGVQHTPGTNSYIIKKATAWLPAHITAAQNVIDAAAGRSAQLSAQAVILNWPIETKALVLTIIDALNVIRAGLPVPLPPITPQQALDAISLKATQL